MKTIIESLRNFLKKSIFLTIFFIPLSLCSHAAEIKSFTCNLYEIKNGQDIPIRIAKANEKGKLLLDEKGNAIFTDYKSNTYRLTLGGRGRDEEIITLFYGDEKNLEESKNIIAVSIKDAKYYIQHTRRQNQEIIDKNFYFLCN